MLEALEVQVTQIATVCVLLVLVLVLVLVRVMMVIRHWHLTSRLWLTLGWLNEASAVERILVVSLAARMLPAVVAVMRSSSGSGPTWRGLVH